MAHGYDKTHGDHPPLPPPGSNITLFILKMPREEGGQPGMTRPSPTDVSDLTIRAPENVLPTFSSGRTRTRRDMKKSRDAVGKKRTNGGKDMNERRDNYNRRVRQRVGIAHDKIGVSAKQERFFKHRTTKNTLHPSPNSLHPSPARDILSQLVAFCNYFLRNSLHFTTSCYILFFFLMSFLTGIFRPHGREDIHAPLTH